MSWMLVIVIMMGSVGALIITVLYVKTLREKRASQERVKSLLRVVAEQSEIRPSATSLTSFTSNIDLNELYSNYSIHQSASFHEPPIVCKEEGDKNKKDFEAKFQDMQLPPSYEDLLK